MPQPAAPAYLRLHAGVFARCSAGSGVRVMTDLPGLGETSGLPGQRRPDTAAPVPASPVGPEHPDATATCTIGNAADGQRHVLDAVRAGLVAEAQGWAARVRLLRAWQAAPVSGERFDQLELAGAWQIAQLTATRWLDEAERLDTCLPQTLAALETGTLLVHQATVLLHRTRHCTQEVARAVDAGLVPVASSLSPSDLRVKVDRTVLRLEAELEPAATEQRQVDAVADRRTFIRPEPDGMGLAGAVLPAPQLIAWQQGLDELERRERIADREAGVERTCDQRRADLFAALPAMVLAGIAQDAATIEADAPRRPWTLGPEQLAAHLVLNVHVPVATVLGLSQAPGSLDGYGPLGASHVRLLRPASLRRVWVDATSGRPVALDDKAVPVVAPEPTALRQQVRDLLVPTVVVDRDEAQHDPSARLARLVDVRDVHCCGPGCSSRRTDRDHLVPHPHGPTSARNLNRLSRRCHRAKHGGWTLVRHPDGSVTWTSPLGRRYHRPSPHDPPPAVDLHADPPSAPPPPPGRPSLSGGRSGAVASSDNLPSASGHGDLSEPPGPDGGRVADDPPPF